MRLLRVEEAAHRLGLKTSTARKLIHLGQIPAVRPTKRAVRVREEDVDALIRVGYRPRQEGGETSAQPGPVRVLHKAAHLVGGDVE